LTSNGEPFAPVRFKQIVKERYEISKRINTSYNDIGLITPRERGLLLEFIEEDIKHDNTVIEKARDKAKSIKSR
jgi:hypothetical protein